MKYQIRRGADTILFDGDVRGTQTQAIMGGNVVNVTFSSDHFIDFALGDFIDVYGERYFLNKLPTFRKANVYEYTAEFQAVAYDLAKYQFLSLGVNNKLEESDFTAMIDADSLIDLIVSNANRVGSGWKRGVVDATDEKNLFFSGETCLRALSRAADEFELEWWVDPDKTIHLTKRETMSGHKFKYGYKNALYDITRQTNDKDVVTRLYAFGSTDNIPGTYRNYSTRLRLPAASAPNNYLERNVSKFGIIEAVQFFDDIKPERICVVSGVQRDVDGIYSIADATLDFNLNDYLIPDVSVKVNFQTGQLAGITLEVISYDHATRSLKLRPNNNEKAITVPSPTFPPAIGDKFIMTDLIMPQSYVTNAENRLLEKAQEYINKNSEVIVQYVVTLNAIYFKQNAIAVILGQSVGLEDSEMEVNKQIRVVRIVRNIQNWWDYVMELSESVVAIPQSVRTYNAIAAAQKAIKINELLNPALLRFRWKTSQELNSKMFDPDGFMYSEKIKPLSIETLMLSVGSRSQQFTLNQIVFEPNRAGNPNNFVSTVGSLVHYTIAEPQIKEWVIGASTYTGLLNKAYYIYARCDKTGTTGTIYLTDQQIKVDENPNFYHFLIGVLHSPIDGVRGISLTYGQTTINGKFIKTGTIYSQDGLTYFNLDTGEIGGKIRFVNPNTGGYQTPDELIESALSQFQADGQIVVWDFPYAPTLSNIPASQWTTNAVRRDHLGDLFFNTVSELGYRFAETSPNVFAWVAENDHGVIKAMKAAADAQDTADGKRRIFTTTPTTPYDVGDLWAQGPTGNIMRCITSRQTGSFNAADWQKADKYTDDTRAIQAETSAEAAVASASVANQKIAEMSSDNLLTPGEKQQLQLQWVSVQGEYPIKVAQAQTYEVSTTAYASAYNALSAYLTPLLNNLNTNSSIVGATLRANWKAYTDASINLSKAITDAAKGLIASGGATLGQLAYLDWVEKARLGTTIIDGGFLRADLLQASRIISLGIESQSGASAKANASLVSAQGYADSRFSTLGGFAWINQITSGAQIGNAVIQAEKLGATIISGGRIVTNLVDSDLIRATIIQTSYIEGRTFNFVRGSVGGFTIGSNTLQSSSGSQSILIYSGASPYIQMRNESSGGYVYYMPDGSWWKGDGVSTYSSNFPEIGGAFLRKSVLDITMHQDGVRGNGGGGWAGLDQVNKKYAAIYAQAYTFNAAAANLQGHVFIGATLTIEWQLRIHGLQANFQTPGTKVPVYWDTETHELTHG